jgi:2,5-dioxopentanoate dehydrogenase
MKFIDSTLNEVDASVKLSEKAFQGYKTIDAKKRAAFLRAIADEIEALGNELMTTAMRETNLPEGRIIGERGRTTGQCRMYANLIEEGSWVEARIDTALPDRLPVPKPDIRKMLVPLGPVVVFGAANFPLAYSTAGGDTISALAAGCTVIVKAHPAHPATSALVAGAIENARIKEDIPTNVFIHLYGADFQVGKALVEHSLVKAVGFTGSFAGGKALFDLANKRPTPIPVFAEMSSINPIVLLPNALESDAENWAQKLASSLTLNVGQFCTSPGLLIGIKDEHLDKFIAALTKAIEGVLPGDMLHSGISSNYSRKAAQALSQPSVTKLSKPEQELVSQQGTPILASVPASEFLKNPLLEEEVFGPFALIVECRDKDQMVSVIEYLQGQLTATVIGNADELIHNKDVINLISQKAGRLIVNGVPTGVEVCPSMNHGGPFPASSDSRFTSVGIDAIKRFVRPLAFQNFPQSLLPKELQDENPLAVWRLFNNEWRK